MEKIEMARTMMSKGIKRDESLRLAGISKNQFYYKLKGTKAGKKKTSTTKWRDPQTFEILFVENEVIVQHILDYKLNPDHPNWYRLICYRMQMDGYYINHKKVYRLMHEYLLLEDPPKKAGRNFVKFRKVAPTGPLQIIEMDIKYVFIEGNNRHSFVFTILDTFTRFVLYWSVGYTMKSNQIQWAWEQVIAEYLQPLRINHEEIVIEVRNDNGKQFSSTQIQEFFNDNELNQLFTKPYTPEENGHIESFHGILSRSLVNDKFATIQELELRLVKFYNSYNTTRCHSGTKGIPPKLFWKLFDLGLVEVVTLKLNHIRLKLKVAYQDILTLPEIKKLISGNTVTRKEDLRCNFMTLDGS